MKSQTDPNHLDLDGRLLRLLLVVLEEGSVTRAANRLDVTQSAVSHMLDKLRTIVGDPLFVKAGRGIVATARAEALAEQARLLLDQMRDFAGTREFEPEQLDFELVVAANDLQRDLLLPEFLRRIRVVAPRMRMRIVPSNVPSAALLREERCHLVITPRPPEGSDIIQRRIFEDRYVVFHDAAVCAAPETLAGYEASEHVTVIHEARGPLDIDGVLADRGIRRVFAAIVANFSGVPAFLRASPYLATLPSLLGRELLRDFAQAEPPFDCPRMPMYLVWHRRHHIDPTHRWLREQLDAVVAEVFGTAAGVAD